MNWLALLRGLNVGGRNRLPMEALVRIFEDAGCTDVRTYIQSGSVVFAPPGGSSRGLAGRELFLRLPNGVADSRFNSAYLDRALGVTTTARNWRTTLRLAEMLGVTG